MEKKKSVGRPPLEPAKRKSVMLHFRVTPQEDKDLSADARAQGVAVGAMLMELWRKWRAHRGVKRETKHG